MEYPTKSLVKASLNIIWWRPCVNCKMFLISIYIYVHHQPSQRDQHVQGSSQELRVRPLCRYDCYYTAADAFHEKCCNVGRNALRMLDAFHQEDITSAIQKMYSIIYSQVSWSKNPIYWIVQRVRQQIPSAFWPYIQKI